MAGSDWTQKVSALLKSWFAFPFPQVPKNCDDKTDLVSIYLVD